MNDRNVVEAWRDRRAKRIAFRNVNRRDTETDEEKWVTIKGTHVLIDDKGNIENQFSEKGAKARLGSKSMNDIAAKETKRAVAQGRDITDSWKRREDRFEFEIEDVINAQGFDGLPKIVSRTEFDKAVADANGGKGFVAQRTYAAPDQDTLDSYRKQLYSGKWYVDCSVGDSVYGQGMYGVANMSGQITPGMREEMQRIIRVNNHRFGEKEASDDTKRDIIETYIRSRKLEGDEATAVRSYLTSQSGLGRPSKEEVNIVKRILGNSGMKDLRTEAQLIANASEGCRTYTETFTFTPDAKIISIGDLRDLVAKTGVKVESRDAGIMAAKLGYDAIYVDFESYVVVLNRTKLIIKEP